MRRQQSRKRFWCNVRTSLNGGWEGSRRAFPLTASEETSKYDIPDSFGVHAGDNFKSGNTVAQCLGIFRDVCKHSQRGMVNNTLFNVNLKMYFLQVYSASIVNSSSLSYLYILLNFIPSGLYNSSASAFDFYSLCC